jgi:hypothetical protein
MGSHAVYVGQLANYFQTPALDDGFTSQSGRVFFIASPFSDH